MPHFALPTDVREESQNVIPADFPNVEIEKEMDYAVAAIRNKIGSYDANHPELDALKKIEILIASAYVLHHYKQFMDLSQSKWDRAQLLLSTVQGALTGAAVDAEYKNTITAYGSWPAAFFEDENTDTRPYKSTSSFVY